MWSINAKFIACIFSDAFSKDLEYKKSYKDFVKIS